MKDGKEDSIIKDVARKFTQIDKAFIGGLKKSS